MGNLARSVSGISLAGVVGATLLTLALGLALKAPCSSANWADGRQYRLLCYSDIVPLYGSERLQGGRLPYLDPCPASAGPACDEYPPLTMYVMRLAAWVSAGYQGFFFVNVAVLALAGVLTAVTLYRLAGSRALYFALAPTLAVYGFMNWDLLAVAFTTAAMLTYVRGRDGETGALLGLGAASKLYPGMLLAPFFWGRFRRGRRRAALVLAVAGVLAYAVLNLPFATLAPSAWSNFFRFNSERPADWDSIWYVACQRVHGGVSCPWPAPLVNALSLVAFVAVAALVWRARSRRDPEFSRWTFGFPLLVAFLLTNKVYSPQFGLWLLPWFAVSLPNVWLFAAFEAADVAVFLTRFSWFGRLARDLGDPAFASFSGVPLGAFEIAVVVRAVVLVVCLFAWAVGEDRWRWGRVERGAVL